MDRHIIAVAGLIGSGKSAVVSGLVNRLTDATAISCDSYEQMTAESKQRIMQWTALGAVLSRHPRRMSCVPRSHDAPTPMG